MVNQGNVGIRTVPILRENKATLYRLHPTEFGQVMIMPNLPNGLHEAELFRNKGYKKNPQELMPDAKLETNPGGELFLVPKGYQLVSRPGKSLIEHEKKTIDVISWVVVKDEKEEEPPTGEHVCDVCGKTAKSAFGLQAHKKSHK